MVETGFTNEERYHLMESDVESQLDDLYRQRKWDEQAIADLESDKAELQERLRSKEWELEEAQETIAELVQALRNAQNEIALLNGQTNSERTCHNISTVGEYWCSACGQRIYGSKGETHDVNFKYKKIAYCPNCGAKVVDE